MAGLLQTCKEAVKGVRRARNMFQWIDWEVIIKIRYYYK